MIKKQLLMLLGALLIACQFAYAHPPTGITAKYNPMTKELKVIVSHPVNKKYRHYVKKIEVSQDNKIIAEKSFVRQTSKVSEFTTFKLNDTITNENITIKAYCNISGELEKTVSLNGAERKQ